MESFQGPVVQWVDEDTAALNNPPPPPAPINPHQPSTLHPLRGLPSPPQVTQKTLQWVPVVHTRYPTGLCKTVVILLCKRALHSALVPRRPAPQVCT